jgi:hypothetical protein
MMKQCRPFPLLPTAITILALFHLDLYGFILPVRQTTRRTAEFLGGGGVRLSRIGTIDQYAIDEDNNSNFTLRYFGGWSDNRCVQSVRPKFLIGPVD